MKDLLSILYEENRVIHNNLWFDRKKRVKNIKEIEIREVKKKVELGDLVQKIINKASSK